MLSIGELSKISQITVKTIRYYQELGIITPVEIDPITNYRYFDKDTYERIRTILTLKDLGFTLSEIKSILDNCKTEVELKNFISSKIIEINNKVKKLKDIEYKLKQINNDLDIARPLIYDEIIEFNLEIPIYTSVQINGRYEDIGDGFRYIYKNAGRYVKGKPYSFFYDLEFKDENPNFKAVLELKKKIKNGNLKSETLYNTKAIKLSYIGPYGDQGKAYLKLFEYCNKNNYKIKFPIIEHYVKGPGYIIKGNPQNYITECIILVDK